MSDRESADGRLDFGCLLDVGAGLVMSFGHRALAQRVVDLAEVDADDRVVDIGCGPGNSARIAAGRAAHVTGVDPSAGMLRVARWLARRHPHVDRLTFMIGSAEAIPVETGAATVAWATASFHHWADTAAGITEARRILGPGGRLLLVEHALDRERQGHGLHSDEVREAEQQLRAVGFTGVGTETVGVGRRRFFVLRGTAGDADPVR